MRWCDEPSAIAVAATARRSGAPGTTRELGEPDLGFLLACNADFAVTEGFGGDVKLERTQAIMQGADHCDFRYQRQKGSAEQ